MSWPEFWETVLPPIAAALAMIITAAAWTAVAYLKNMRDKFEEGKDREALHSAVSTGVRASLATDPCAGDKQIVASTAKYVLEKGAPDAVKSFNLSGQDLNRMVASKLTEERAKSPPQKPC